MSANDWNVVFTIVVAIVTGVTAFLIGRMLGKDAEIDKRLRQEAYDRELKKWQEIADKMGGKR